MRRRDQGRGLAVCQSVSWPATTVIRRQVQSKYTPLQCRPFSPFYQRPTNWRPRKTTTEHRLVDSTEARSSGQWQWGRDGVYGRIHSIGSHQVTADGRSLEGRRTHDAIKSSRVIMDQLFNRLLRLQQLLFYADLTAMPEMRNSVLSKQSHAPTASEDTKRRSIKKVHRKPCAMFLSIKFALRRIVNGEFSVWRAIDILSDVLCLLVDIELQTLIAKWEMSSLMNSVSINSLSPFRV